MINHLRTICLSAIATLLVTLSAVGQSPPMAVFVSTMLERIPVSIGGLWIFDSESGISEANTSVKLPILKLFGSPPPIIKVGFDYTNLDSNAGLPENFYQYSIGVSGVRSLNKNWTIRSMLGVALATDNQNRSSDAWQFRGGVFGIRQTNARALSVGRS